MSPVAGLGSLQNRGDTPFLRCFEKRLNMPLPPSLIEVKREEPTSFILKKRIGADHLLAAQMIENGLISYREELAIWTFGILDLRLAT